MIINPISSINLIPEDFAQEGQAVSIQELFYFVHKRLQQQEVAIPYLNENFFKSIIVHDFSKPGSIKGVILYYILQCGFCSYELHDLLKAMDHQSKESFDYLLKIYQNSELQKELMTIEKIGTLYKVGGLLFTTYDYIDVWKQVGRSPYRWTDAFDVAIQRIIRKDKVKKKRARLTVRRRIAQQATV